MTVQLSDLGVLAEKVKNGATIEIYDRDDVVATIVPAERPTLKERLAAATARQTQIPDWFFEEDPPKLGFSPLQDPSSLRETRTDVTRDEILDALIEGMQQQGPLTLTRDGTPLAEIGPPRRIASVEDLVRTMVEYGIERGLLNPDCFRNPLANKTRDHLEMLLEATGVFIR